MKITLLKYYLKYLDPVLIMVKKRAIRIKILMPENKTKYALMTF